MPSETETYTLLVNDDRETDLTLEVALAQGLLKLRERGAKRVEVLFLSRQTVGMDADNYPNSAWIEPTPKA